ncbi:MAG: flagellar hook-length control protein FliK [Georgfuchsia sp.]
MDLQFSNPITSPSVSTVAPGNGIQSEQLDVPADGASTSFAQLLAQTLPHGNARTVPVALKVSGTDSKDQKIPIKADLTSQTASIISAIVIADDQKTTIPNPHSSLDSSESGIEVAVPIIASFMQAQQAAGAKTISDGESTCVPFPVSIVPKSASLIAATTNPTAQPGTVEAQTPQVTPGLALKTEHSTTFAMAQPGTVEVQTPQVNPGFALKTEHSATFETIALTEKPVIREMGFNAMHTDRIASMPSPTPSTGQAIPTQQLALPAPLGSYDWNSQLGQRIVWMSGQQNQVANISINPPELGPVELRLTLDNQQSTQNATLHFVSPHAAVREAIETSMPRLRELMADAGITLGNATVSGESYPQQQTFGQESTAAKNTATLSSGKSGAIEAMPPSASSRGSTLLDTFA